MTLHTVDSDVAYADGAENFAVYIKRDGTFTCTNERLCPRTKMNGIVHNVSSANAYGITFQLRNGSLYYQDPQTNLWITDDEAAQAGVVNGHLYRLMRTGTLFKNGIIEDDNVEYIIITDTEIISHYRSSRVQNTELKRLSASSVKTAETTSSYFRSPLTVEYT